ncbi:unnamed protein product, partial [Staurois parvus]
MQGPGRTDIVNAGSGETGYSECGVQGLRLTVKCGVPGESGLGRCGTWGEAVPGI